MKTDNDTNEDTHGIRSCDGTSRHAAEHVLGVECPHIQWWHAKYLCQLYFMMLILFLGSTSNGFDSSLLNGLQTLDIWQLCR